MVDFDLNFCCNFVSVIKCQSDFFVVAVGARKKVCFISYHSMENTHRIKCGFSYHFTILLMLCICSESEVM